MPGSTSKCPARRAIAAQKLVAAVEAGEVSRDMVRTRALNILRLMQRVNALDDLLTRAERADDRRATAR